MNRIKEVLLEQGRSQIWLASKIGKSKTSVVKYCNNNSQPRLDTLIAIAKILDVPTENLIKTDFKK